MEFNEYGFSPFPDFFRIYNSHEHSQRLVFPSGYKKYYPTPLPHTVVLKKPEGNFWNAKWTISQDDTISFEDGWHKFVIDNGIREEDYVLFTYDGCRVFWVRIYRNGLLVKPESPIKIQEISDDEDETIGGDDHDTEEDSNENKIISLSLGSSSDEDYDVADDDDEDDTMICEVNKASNGSSIFKGESSRGRGGWIGDPEMYLDDPKNPYFISTLSRCRQVLVIAMQVRKDYDLKFGNTVNFIDGFGVLERTLGEWKDRLVVHKWEEIYKRNNTKPGDTIICEIVRERGVVHSIKVHFIKK